MSDHRLRRDMIECGLLSRTGTSDEAVAVLRGLRREARALRPRASRRGWTGPVLAVVLATVALAVSWSALAIFPTVLGLAVLLGFSARSAPRRDAAASAPRAPRQPQRQ